MTNDILIREDANGVATLTMNTPKTLNALSEDMISALQTQFDDLMEDKSTRVVILRGSGKAFCAGMDLSAEGNVFGLDESRTPTLKEMQAYEEMDGVRDSAGKVTLAIYDCKKPVIGAINGAAVGVGATMACAMDIRLASEKARFGFVFGKIGIVAEGCSTWFLPRIVGMQQSLKWMLLLPYLQVSCQHRLNKTALHPHVINQHSVRHCLGRANQSNSP